MYVDETDDKNSAGLFGYINIRKNGAEVGVKDLTIADAVVIADENGLKECSAGILAGRVMGADTQSIVFENITVSGSVTVTITEGMNNIGGMLGYASWVKATNCHAKMYPFPAEATAVVLLAMITAPPMKTAQRPAR